MPRRPGSGRYRPPVFKSPHTIRAQPKPERDKILEDYKRLGRAARGFVGEAASRYQGPGAPGPSPRTRYQGASTRLSGTALVRAAVKKKAKGKAPAKVTTARQPGRGASGTSRTVPAHASRATPTNPRSAAGQTVTQKARAQARAKPKPKPRPVEAPLSAELPGEAGTAPLTAQQLAEAEFAPTFTGYELEATKDAAAAEQRRQAVQGFTLALMRELGGLPAGVAADYGAASKATEGVASAAAAQLRGEGTSAGARLAADLAAIGAPAEAGAASAQMTGDVFSGGAGALYQTQGAIPTEFLVGEGTRQTAFSRQLPAIAGLSGQQNMRQALYEEEQQRQELGGRRAATLREMGARVPFYQQQLNVEEARQAEAERDYEVKIRAQEFNERLATATYGLNVEKAKISASQGAQRIRIQAIQNDRSWQATLRRLGISEAGLQLRAAELEAKYQNRGRNGGMTPYQASQAADRAADLAADFYNGVQDKDGNVLQEPLAAAPSGYQEAMSDLLSRGIPLTLAQRALNRWWRTPGKNGRPRVPFQLRQQRKKK